MLRPPGLMHASHLGGYQTAMNPIDLLDISKGPAVLDIDAGSSQLIDREVKLCQAIAACLVQVGSLRYAEDRVWGLEDVTG